MHLSVNELETLARKSAVGAGVDHGHAAEAACALLRFLAAGVDAVPLLVQELQAWADGRTGPLEFDRENGTCRLQAATGRAASVLRAAPALRDFTQLMLDRTDIERVELRGVTRPGWVIGHLAAESWQPGISVHCLEPDGAGTRWRIRISGNLPVLLLVGRIDDPRPADLIAEPDADHGDSPPLDGCRTRQLPADMPGLHARGVDIDPGDHAALKRFFDLTLVADSKSSRQHGAGAGLVDTD